MPFLETFGRHKVEDRPLAKLPRDVADLAASGKIDDKRQTGLPDGLWREEQRLDGVRLHPVPAGAKRVARQVAPSSRNRTRTKRLRPRDVRKRERNKRKRDARNSPRSILQRVAHVGQPFLILRQGS